MKFGDMEDHLNDYESSTKKINSLRKEKSDLKQSFTKFVSIGAVSGLSCFGGVLFMAANPSYSHNSSIAATAAALFLLMSHSAYKLVTNSQRGDQVNFEINKIESEEKQVTRELRNGGVEISKHGASIIDKEQTKRNISSIRKTPIVVRRSVL